MGRKSTKIIRTPHRAEGGITESEATLLRAHADLWIARLMRTDSCDRDELTRAIKDLYRVSGLKEPRIVIVPSPLVMAFAYGASAAIWHRRDATYAATAAATRAGRPEQMAARACYDLAGYLGLSCAYRWHSVYQGGAWWGSLDCYLTAARDILGLRVQAHSNYDAWERAAIHGTFRVMHPDFCIVSDFPEVLKVDEQNRPHCENGPSHRWRDGWELYHWHGVRVPDHWITNRDALDPTEVIRAQNVEQRAAGAAIVGWPRMLAVLDARTIDDSGNDDVGSLIELTLPGLPEPGRFLKAVCPRNGLIVEGIPRVSDIDGSPIDTAIAAQAWRVGETVSTYQHPKRRT